MDSVHGWSQIANVCQQNMRPGKTSLDICLACLRMCDVTGLETLALRLNLLDARLLDADRCADWLVKRLLVCTSDALCFRRQPNILWRLLLHVMVVCIAWLFPSHSRWRKTSPPVRGFGLVLLLPVLFCGLPASTILRLRGMWGSCWSRDSAGCCGGKSGPKIGANRPCAQQQMSSFICN